jgi:hypothetical protein
MEFLFGLGMFLMFHLLVGLAFAIKISALTEEQIEASWKAVGLDNHFTPKSYKSFMFAIYVLLGFFNIPMYILAIIMRGRL